MSKPAQTTSIYQRIIALVLALSIGLLSLAAVSPGLHKQLHVETAPSCGGHHDCDSEGSESDSHQCAVTLLEIGSPALTVITTQSHLGTVVETLIVRELLIIDSNRPAPKDARAPPAVVIV